MQQQQCALLGQCPFLTMLVADEPELVDYFLSLYCQGDYAVCARFEAARELGQEQVPPDLFPNEQAFTSLVALAGCRATG